MVISVAWYLTDKGEHMTFCTVNKNQQTVHVKLQYIDKHIVFLVCAHTYMHAQKNRNKKIVWLLSLLWYKV